MTATTYTQLPASTITLMETPPAIVLTSTVTAPPSTSTVTTTATATATATSTVFEQGSTTKTNDCTAGTSQYDYGFGYTATVTVTFNGFSGRGYVVKQLVTDSFSACLNDCKHYACDALDWNILTGDCTEYNGPVYGPSQNYGFDYASVLINI